MNKEIIAPNGNNKNRNGIKPPNCSLDEKQEIQVSERFKFLWDNYTKIINLCITLSVGTLLIFANNIFTKDNIEKLKIADDLIRFYAIASILLIFLGLLFAILWRILSQIYMEKEVFGNKKVIIQYLKDAEIYDHSYKFEENRSKFKRRVWIFAQYATFFLLFFGWLFFMLFILNFLWM